MYSINKMSELTELEINKIVENYKKQKLREKSKYESIKDDDNFKIKNRERARLHYQNNKDKKKKKYQDNKDLLNAKSLLQYYKYNDKVNIFIDKHSDKIDILKNNGIIVN